MLEQRPKDTAHPHLQSQLKLSYTSLIHWPWWDVLLSPVSPSGGICPQGGFDCPTCSSDVCSQPQPGPALEGAAIRSDGLAVEKVLSRGTWKFEPAAEKRQREQTLLLGHKI